MCYRDGSRDGIWLISVEYDWGHYFVKLLWRKSNRVTKSKLQYSQSYCENECTNIKKYHLCYQTWIFDTNDKYSKENVQTHLRQQITYYLHLSLVNLTCKDAFWVTVQHLCAMFPWITNGVTYTSQPGICVPRAPSKATLFIQE